MKTSESRAEVRSSSVPAGTQNRSLVRFCRLGFLAFVSWLCLTRAHAHSASTAWLSLRVEGVGLHGTWDIPVRDVDLALALDTDGDGRVTWGEVRRQSQTIGRWATAGLGVVADGVELPVQVRLIAVSQVSGVDCLHLECVATARGQIRSLELAYRLLFDVDGNHRGLVRVSSDRVPGGVSGVLGPDQRVLRLESEGELRPVQVLALGGFVAEGIHHIATGYDHLLFLLVLLLPTVVVRAPSGWARAGDWRPVLMRVLKTVTAFTFAHSITLALAALDWVRPPSRPIEIGIALSIVVTAVGNLVRVEARLGTAAGAGLRALEMRPWLLPFCFGLIHGFGFADGLRELGLSRSHLAVPLFGFNLGVELGQLVAVLIVLPVLWKFGRTVAYQRWGLAGLSAGVAAVASVWVVGRTLGFEWLGG